jgi:hypothetical protein
MAKTCPVGLIARPVRVRTQPLLSDVKIRKADAACSISRRSLRPSRPTASSSSRRKRAVSASRMRLTRVLDSFQERRRSRIPAKMTYEYLHTVLLALGALRARRHEHNFACAAKLSLSGHVLRDQKCFKGNRIQYFW